MKSMKLAFLAAIAAMTFAVGCDDGPVGKAINCAQICDRFDECISSTDESNCREECKDEASNDDAAQCSECLDGDSCTDCSAACAGVGISLLFN